MTVGIVQVLSAGPAKNSTAHDTTKPDGPSDFADLVDGGENRDSDTVRAELSSWDEQPKDSGLAENDAREDLPQRNEDENTLLAVRQNSVEPDEKPAFDIEIASKRAFAETGADQTIKMVPAEASFVGRMQPIAHNSPETKTSNRASIATQRSINPDTDGSAQTRNLSATGGSIDASVLKTATSDAVVQSTVTFAQADGLPRARIDSVAHEKARVMPELKTTNRSAAATQNSTAIASKIANTPQDAFDENIGSHTLTGKEVRVPGNISNSQAQNALPAYAKAESAATSTDVSKTQLKRPLKKANMEFQDSRSDRNNRILDRNFTSQGTSFETAAKMRDNNPTTENLIKQAYFQNDKGAASVIPEISLLETQEIPDKLELARLDSPSRNLEPSSGVQGSSAFSSQQAKSDQVRQIMVQIFQGTAPKEGETIQIRLTPEELGTVTYRLSTSEAGPVIHVISDRAETLDLLRRNTDQLLAEFAEFGFSDADVTFSDDMSSNSPTGTDDSEADGVAPGLAQGSNPTIAYKLNVAHGVDIRI